MQQYDADIRCIGLLLHRKRHAWKFSTFQGLAPVSAFACILPVCRCLAGSRTFRVRNRQKPDGPGFPGPLCVDLNAFSRSSQP
jgi:hypothetical protein